MRIPRGLWNAPSATVYASDGLPVCTLGTADVVKAYRQRGDTAGEMIADTAHLIATLPKLLEAVEMIEELADLKTDCISEKYRISRIRAIALEAVASTIRLPSPCERGEVFTVPR